MDSPATKGHNASCISKAQLKALDAPLLLSVWVHRKMAWKNSRPWSTSPKTSMNYSTPHKSYLAGFAQLNLLRGAWHIHSSYTGTVQTALPPPTQVCLAWDPVSMIVHKRCPGNSRKKMKTYKYTKASPQNSLLASSSIWISNFLDQERWFCI